MRSHDEPRWRRYLRFWGPNPDADVEEEIQFHLEMHTRRFEEAGMDPETAREAARAAFGDVDDVRDWLRDHDRKQQRRKDRAMSIDALLQDLRYGARKLRDQPLFTLAAVLVLGLGIGATAAIFSAVDAVLLRPLPFADDARLVQLEGVRIPMVFPGDPERKTAPELADAAAQRDVFSAVAAYAPGGLNLTGTAEPVRVKITMASTTLFPTLGVRPILGRNFNPEEGLRGSTRATILSYDLWRRHFGADRDVIGRSVALNGESYRIVGVMPRGFGFPESTELWTAMPMPMTFGDWEPFRQYMPSRVVARLAEGATPEQAQARLLMMLREYETPQRPLELAAAELAVPIRQELVGERRGALLILLGATALVLLVACANVANLLISRTTSRRREIALRSVLGATPGRVLRQLMVESLMLAAIGGIVGIAIAFLSLGLLEALVPTHMAGAANLQVDFRVLGFTAVIVLLTGIAFGLWPALAARRTDPNETIKEGSSGVGVSREPARLRRVLVVGEVAVALVLLIGAAVMLRSFSQLVATDIGMEPENVATLELTLAKATYSKTPARREFLKSVLERISATPGIEAAGFINHLPLSGDGSIAITVYAEGRRPDRWEDMAMARDLRVTPGYFEAMGIRLLRGRTLAADSAVREVVIGQKLAQRLWPGEDPIGQRLGEPGGRQGPEVVGLIADVRAGSVEQDTVPQMYQSLLATPYADLALVARGAIPASVLKARLQAAVRDIDPDQAVHRVRMMEDVVSSSVAPKRANTMLISVFGAIALVLAGVGVYGVIAYGVARRTREIGIRMALGASSSRVMRSVLTEGLVLVLVGTALGLAGAWALTQVLSGLLFGVSARDPIAFVVAPVAMIVVAALATLIPARRATRVDPIQAIRVE